MLGMSPCPGELGVRGLETPRKSWGQEEMEEEGDKGQERWYPACTGPACDPGPRAAQGQPTTHARDPRPRAAQGQPATHARDPGPQAARGQPPTPVTPCWPDRA